MDISINLNVQDLVQDSLDFIRIASQFNNFSGYDLERGTKLLNEIIAEMNATSAQLPFYYSLKFDIIVNQAKYLIGQGPDADVIHNYLNNVTYVNVFYSNIRYPVTIIEDYDALSTAIQQNITFLPSNARIYLQNDDAGNTYTVLDFLFPPDQTYVCEIRGKPTLNVLTINDTIYDLPLYYRSYLRMELGKRLIPYYGQDAVWTDNVEQQYQVSKKIIRSNVELDLRVRTNSALMNYPGPYAYKLGINYS